MQGVILPGHERVEIERFGLPEPGHGQALVRMKASGLCGSDLRAIYHEHKGPGAERYQNVIACLEPTGQLEAVGPGVSNFEAQGEGGSVTFEPNPLLLHKQLTLHGLWVCGIFEMGQLLEHLARKQLHPEATMTPSFPLSETKQAYETFDAGKTGKVVISWEDE
jgi:threonine dehydrogenase-like Zn-dependent dehydrogenase